MYRSFGVSRFTKVFMVKCAFLVSLNLHSTQALKVSAAKSLQSHACGRINKSSIIAHGRVCLADCVL